jgi:hypothetical protein
MLGRLSATERRSVRARLRIDPSSRSALRRLRNSTLRVRVRLGRVDTVQQLPPEWLTLIARAAPRVRAKGESAKQEEPPLTWLRSSAHPSIERIGTWL